MGAQDHRAEGKIVATTEKKPFKIAAFAEGLAMVGLDKDLTAGKPIAPRKAYGAALVALGAADPDNRIVGLDADVKNSTHAEWFAKKFPAKFLECKIAEQNMYSVAAGLSAAGKIPFTSTFAKFVMRGYDQIEMAIIGGANLKITGSHAGVTLAADGPSQMSLPDVAFFRSMCHVKNFNGAPAVRYFFPADAVSTYKITEMMANLDGACYLRTLRAETKILYKPDDTFEVGGFKVLREGKDLVFVAAGYMVHECLKAADELAKQGKKAGGSRRLQPAAEHDRPAAARRPLRRDDRDGGGQLHRRPRRRDRHRDRQQRRRDHAEEPARATDPQVRPRAAGRAGLPRPGHEGDPEGGVRKTGSHRDTEAHRPARRSSPRREATFGATYSEQSRCRSCATPRCLCVSVAPALLASADGPGARELRGSLIMKSWSRRIPFKVDIAGIIEIMGTSLYSRATTPVRELIQNAHDGIMRRRGRELSYAGRIDVTQDAAAGR
jgi:transketolase C-terminal domain/subunit